MILVSKPDDGPWISMGWIEKIKINATLEKRLGLTKNRTENKCNTHPHQLEFLTLS